MTSAFVELRAIIDMKAKTESDWVHDLQGCSSHSGDDVGSCTRHPSTTVSPFAHPSPLNDFHPLETVDASSRSIGVRRMNGWMNRRMGEGPALPLAVGGRSVERRR